ncbi:MAG: hypothetical protein WBD04_02990 [Candidatus Omnitrophota bacterium]
MNSAINKNYRIIVILFFAAALCAGIITFRDYGISWDELVSRDNGRLTYEYVFEGNQELLSYNDRYYGTAFELSLFLLEKACGLEDSRQVFFLRHLATFLLFWVGAIFFYFLCRDRFKSWKMGLLGSLFLILSPRIFAHSFYNSKDLAFLSIFIISIFSLVKYLERKSLLRTTFHALTCAFLIATRILGIMVFFFTALFVVMDLLTGKEKEKGKALFSFAAYVFLTMSCTVLFWPILWIAPVSQFTTAFNQMSHFNYWSSVLFLGEYVKGKSLPWHYVPVWILVTTPVLYTVLFASGLVVLIKEAFKAPLRFCRERGNDLIWVLWFFTPIISVIALKSVLYDGWRHLFFVYPAFLMISLTGLTSWFELIKTKFRRANYKIAVALFSAVISVSLLGIFWFMVKYHPYQNVYFNVLTGNMKNAKNNFDMDYWGLSYRQALEYILENDKSDPVKICAAWAPGYYNFFILTPEEKKRIEFVKEPEQADYFMGEYRWHKGEYPYENEFYSIKVAGAKIMVVYKLR